MSCVTELNKNLAALLSLHIYAKSSHWNVRGNNFFSAHGLFDKLSEAALDWADSIGETLGYFGKEAESTTKIASGSYLGPFKVGIDDEEAHFKAHLGFLEKIHDEISDSIEVALKEKDQITADVFIEVGRGVCKFIYFIQSHVSKQ